MLIGPISDMLIVSYIWRFSITTKKLTITKKKKKRERKWFWLRYTKAERIFATCAIGSTKMKIIPHKKKKEKEKKNKKNLLWFLNLQ